MEHARITNLYPEVVARASHRFGLITRQELRALGLSHTSIHRLVQAAFLIPIHPGVFRLPGERTWFQALEAARLYADPLCALACGRSAGALWGLAGVPPGRIEIMTRRRLRSRGGVVYRQRPSWPESDAARVKGVLATTLERTVLDLAALVPPEVFDIALDSALRIDTSIDRIAERFQFHARSGRRGTTVTRRALEERIVERVPLESALERAFLTVVRRFDLPVPLPQYEVLENGQVLARLDFAYPDLKIGIELDGYAHHSGRGAFERDRVRLSQLAARSWRILVFTKKHLSEAEHFVAHTIKRARSLAQVS